MIKKFHPVRNRSRSVLIPNQASVYNLNNNKYSYFLFYAATAVSNGIHVHHLHIADNVNPDFSASSLELNQISFSGLIRLAPLQPKL